jgi:ubiquinone/menaquinone biosynthesis C-methylase UbiE
MVFTNVYKKDGELRCITVQIWNTAPLLYSVYYRLLISTIMWIITRAINQYDQDGDYFETAYENKPTLDELLKFFRDEELAKHVLNGGGRRDFEGSWYFLTEIKSGEQYVHS